ncbi:MAG: hypothetical protein IPJ06_00635 [Saprospiraceae bacterium]|nr:hypothetical protein [Saprospiraceae bacterium]
MSMIDKINKELMELQKELDQLHHYSQQIGEAKDASSKVVKASEAFVASFKERVSAVTDAMEKAALEFTTTTRSAEDQFTQAKEMFLKGIQESRASLSEIQSHLDVAAGNVRDMAELLKGMNIPAQFQKVQDSLLSIERMVSTQGSDVSSRLTAMEQSLASSKSTQTILLVVSILVLIGVVVILVLR